MRLNPPADELGPLIERNHSGLRNTGELCLDIANVIGWGTPLRGAFILVPRSAGEAEVHVVVDSEARGRESVEAAREALAFVRSRGLKLFGRTPLKDRAARWFAMAAGMRKTGVDGEWMLTES